MFIVRYQNKSKSNLKVMSVTSLLEGKVNKHSRLQFLSGRKFANSIRDHYIYYFKVRNKIDNNVKCNI